MTHIPCVYNTCVNCGHWHYYSCVGGSSRGVWSLGIHDNHYGNVSCISLTYDDQYLLTGAGDGNVFIYKTNLPANSPTLGQYCMCEFCSSFLCGMKLIFV